MTNKLPDGLDTLLPRAKLAAALTEAGFPIAGATLSTMATRGGGPPFQKFSVRAVYRWGDALEWARSRLSAPRRSTSEAQVQQVAP